MYKCLLFDLDDTLLDFKGAEAIAIRQVLNKFNIDSSDDTVKLYSDINDSFWKRFERGEIKRSEIFEGRFITLAKELGKDLDTAEISKEYFHSLSACGIVFPDTVRLLEQLKGKYILCAATNGNTLTQRRRIALSGIEGFFDGGIYISEEIGYQKPQKEFFDYIFHKLSNPPREEILMLGDSLSGDILGANTVGIDSCFVNLRGQPNPKRIKPTYTVSALLDIPEVCGL